MSPGSPLPFLEGATWSSTEGAVRARGRLAPGDPIYAGHFPGRPILPAIGQLELARAALSLALGRPLALVGIPHLKLRQTLVPGQEIEIEIGAETDSGLRTFAVRSLGAPVTTGALRFGPQAGGGPGAADSSSEAGREPLTGLLPHAPPACFLRGIETSGAEEIVCLACVPAEHALVREGWAPNFLALEAGAQAAGVLEAGARREGGAAPSVGYVVGMRDVEIAFAPIAAGHPFRITARRVGGAGALAVYEVEASGAGGPIAKGTLSAFLPDRAE